MINFVFDNFYYRLIIASILCLMIAFVDSYHLFHSRAVNAVLLIVLVVMLMSSQMEEDYGLVLLIVALFILSYNATYLYNKRNSSVPVRKPSASPTEG